VAAHDLRCDADDVPLPDLADLVVEPDPARAGDDHVGLLLLAGAVAARRADARGVAPVADAEVTGADVLAAEPASIPGKRPPVSSSTPSRLTIA